MRGLRLGFGFGAGVAAAPPPAPLRQSLIIFDSNTNNALRNPASNAFSSPAREWVTLVDENGGSAPNWLHDNGGTTASSHTGPPAENPYPFLYTETSGASSLNLDADPNRMLIGKNGTAMESLRFLYNANGRGFSAHTGADREGIELQFLGTTGLSAGPPHWLIPWDDPLTSTDVEGGEILWNAGTENTHIDPDETRPPIRAYGWADSGDIPVPAGTKEVLLIARIHAAVGPGSTYQHDISLRELDIRYRPAPQRDTAFDESYDGEEYQ